MMQDCSSHSSVDPSVTTNLRPRIRSTRTTVCFFNLDLNCNEKKTKNKQKEAVIDPKKYCSEWTRILPITEARVCAVDLVLAEGRVYR